MREWEAAAFLAVTPRTVRNYRRRGLLPFRQTPGKTCPTIEYEPADLARLKATLAAQAKATAGRKVRAGQGANPLPRVSFGLPPEEFCELTAEAKRLGLKPGEYARRLMRESIESRLQADIRELREQDERYTKELARLRKNVSDSFEAVLEFVGLAPAEAKDWTRRNLR